MCAYFDFTKEAGLYKCVGGKLALKGGKIDILLIYEGFRRK
jgi:hypothetical protein